MKCQMVIDKKRGPHMVLSDDTMKQLAKSLIGFKVEDDEGRVVGKIISAEFMKDHINCEAEITDPKATERIRMGINKLSLPKRT